MKKIVDFIGDGIVTLMVWSLYILFPLATISGIISGLFLKMIGVKSQPSINSVEGANSTTSTFPNEKNKQKSTFGVAKSQPPH